MGDEGPGHVSSSDLLNDKKVLLFALPGAFTPGCSMTHLPGYTVNADTTKSWGVDRIDCSSVNDAFVMGAGVNRKMPTRSSCSPTAVPN